MSKEKVIELSNVVKSYGRHKVLDKEDMTVYRNNVYAFLGNNGEGKTTTIKLLAGQLEPDSGSVRVFGKDPVAAGTAIKTRTAYVSELMRVYDWMNLAELRNFLKPFYPTWNDGMFEKLVRTFELPIDRKLGSFSRGMYAKSVFLLGVCRKPELLILDDPFLGLDTASRRNFMEMLVDSLTDFDCTVLFSTHLIPEIAGVADRVGILSGGRLVVEMDTTELQENIRQLKLPAASEKLLPELDVMRKKYTGPELWLTVRGGEKELEAKLGGIAGLAFELKPLPLEEIFLAYTELSSGC